MSKRPMMLVFEYEIDDDVPNHFDAAFEMLRQHVAALPPLGQPFNVAAFAGGDAHRVAQAVFGRDCSPT